MDMNKILQNFEDAATGEYTPSKQESSDMKMILESFYNVAQEDAGETAPQQLDEIASVTMSGDSADEVAQLVKLMNDAGAPEAAPVGPQPTTMPAPVDIPADGPPDMPPKDTMITPKMMDDFDAEEEPVAEEDYENEPDERYDDHETMTLDLSGGINRRKPKGSIRVKDPANFSENSLAEELSSMLKKKMSEKKDQDGDGDNDFDDVQIARMKASGMSHDEAVAKVKGKKESSKKNSDTEVDEAGKMKGGGDDPCWKGYKMVGTKKKGGKEVPNCVPREGIEEAKSDSMSKKFNKAMSWTADKPAEMKKKIAKMSDQELEKLKSTEKEKPGSGSAREFQIKAIDREMKKRGLTPSNESAPKNNPVAKNAGKFNKAQVQTDKKKEMKKGKVVKHKGKDLAMESAPVFDRYVKPIINKTPKQMVEFYDSEARTIINRLSRERRSLAEANGNTKMHDVVIGRLRENLDVVSEAPYRRGYRRRSGDINRIGYGDGRGANLGSDKAAFKRREMEVELGDEEPNNYAVSIGGKPWKVFRSQRQAEKAAATIKNKYGKDTKVFQTAAPPSS